MNYRAFRQFLMNKEASQSKDPRLARAGVSGYNQVKRTPGHPTKSHIVVAKEGDRVKTIRFGQQGVKTNQTAGQREAFKSRHRKNIARGKMSAAYWADKAKWSPKKTKDKDNQKWVKGAAAPGVSSYMKDFVGGIDPFGTYTSQYGQAAQQAGLSEKDHAKKRAVSTVGGLVGGGLLVPAAIGGTVKGVSALGGGGSIAQRLARAGSAALQGAVEPYSNLRKAYNAKTGLREIAAGGMPSQAQREGLEFVAQKSTLGDVFGKLKGGLGSAGPDAQGFGAQAGEAAKKLLRGDSLRDVITGAVQGNDAARKAVAEKLAPQVSSAFNRGLASLGMGAGVGGAGAYVQYGKGRDAEKEFQQRNLLSRK